MVTPNKVSFPLGQFVMTASVNEAVADGFNVLTYVARHARGDWGDIADEDRGLNEQALKDGDRLFSVYNTPEIGTLWIITEWDRSATTALKPDEY